MLLPFLTLAQPGQSLYLLLSFLSYAALVLSAKLTEVTNFGPNPTNVQMYTYIPDNLLPNPSLVVAIHYCNGTAQEYHTGTQFSNLADKYGYIVIYPDAPSDDGCWDVHTEQTLLHDVGGDSVGIASMVRYAMGKYSIDRRSVFMVGTSSGGMMVNVLASAYPDLFAAGSVVSGVPYGCFKGPGTWNDACAEGELVKTGQEWGDLVREAYRGMYIYIFLFLASFLAYS